MSAWGTRCMPALSEAEIAGLIEPYLSASIGDPSSGAIKASVSPLPIVCQKLSAYLDVLLSWNARTNLTAIRTPGEIAQRHFGESLFAARVLARAVSDGAQVLDFGTGAGFPGLPAQILLPGIQVMLAESQSKKVAFLREAVRVVGVPAQIWGGRVETLEEARKFEVVMLRAVDHVDRVLPSAIERVREGGYLLEMHGGEARRGGSSFPIPGLDAGWVTLTRMNVTDVPRGTE